MSEEKRRTVDGIDESSYNLWRNSPVTMMFRKYLNDYAVALEKGHTDRWLRGAATDDVESEARGRVLAAREMSDLPFDDVYLFYQDDEEKEEEHEAEDDQDETS